MDDKTKEQLQAERADLIHQRNLHSIAISRLDQEIAAAMSLFEKEAKKDDEWEDPRFN